MRKPKVVIVGAGFAGLACARKLSGKPVDVEILDRHNYHLFTPFLYQVATALLNPSDIAFPLRQAVRRDHNVSFKQYEVTGIDLDTKLVHTAAGKEIPYDYMVLAAGMETNYFAKDEIRKVSFPLSQMTDAIRLRNHILGCLEAATHEEDRNAVDPWLTFVVVGGGPTGVEFCGALAELCRLVVPNEYKEIPQAALRIVLVEGRERILPTFHPRLSAYAQKKLVKLGVEIRAARIVTAATPKAVDLDDGEAIDTRTLVWAAGVKPAPLLASLGLATSATGRIHVNEKLQIIGYEGSGAYAVGDNASFVWDGQELPAVAMPAMQEARHVGYNIVQDVRAGASGPEPFRYWNKGSMAAVARWACVAQIGKLRLTGFLGWLAWALVHIWYLIGFRNRLAVLWGWFWDYLHYDRPIRVQIEEQHAAEAGTPRTELGITQPGPPSSSTGESDCPPELPQ